MTHAYFYVYRLVLREREKKKWHESSHFWEKKPGQTEGGGGGVRQIEDGAALNLVLCKIQHRRNKVD